MPGKLHKTYNGLLCNPRTFLTFLTHDLSHMITDHLDYKKSQCALQPTAEGRLTVAVQVAWGVLYKVCREYR